MKGTDYWTEADKAEIVEDTKNAIDLSGKVNKSGDTMTGSLTLRPEGVTGFSRVFKNADATNDYGLKMQDQDAAGNFIGFTLSASLQGLEFQKKAAGESEYSYSRLYDSDNPPTAEETGALPNTGGTVHGDLVVQNSYPRVHLKVSDTLYGTMMKNADETNDYGLILRDHNGENEAVLKISAKNKNVKLAVDGNEYVFYHEGNLPEPGNTSTVQTVTLGVNGWAQGSDGRYAQTVSVTGVAADTPVVNVDVNTDGADQAADTAMLAAWAGPSAWTPIQGAGTLTFYSLTLPDVSIEINVGVC